ncbi:hypothetical protein DFH09DRAFT_1392080 [Mycena vulgaris]|nr:hypothetical protein DFH09DRAFT_1392080 [Mycena vulgaris]
MRDWGDTEGLRREREGAKREKGRGNTREYDAVAWSRAADYAEWHSRRRARVLRAWTQAAEVGKKLTPYGSGVPGARPSVDTAEGRERTRDKGARAHEGRGKRVDEIAKGGVQEKRADERRAEEQDKQKLKEEGARGLRSSCTTAMLTKLRARIRARIYRESTLTRSARTQPQPTAARGASPPDSLRSKSVGCRPPRGRRKSGTYQAPVPPSPPSPLEPECTLRERARPALGVPAGRCGSSGGEGEVRGEKKQRRTRARNPSCALPPCCGCLRWVAIERRGGGGGGGGEGVLREVLGASGIGIPALLLHLAHRSRHAIRYALAPIPILARSIHLATLRALALRFLRRSLARLRRRGTGSHHLVRQCRYRRTAGEGGILERGGGKGIVVP